MQYNEQHPFYCLLATRYDPKREDEAIRLLKAHPKLATLTWLGPDIQGQPFVKGSTALHYAASDGKLRLMEHLIDLGANVNADGANWFRSVLSWAANNARISAIELLLARGAAADSLDAMHAAAWGGSSAGSDEDKDYVGTLKCLLAAGADLNDTRHHNKHTPLRVAMESGNQRAEQFLRAQGARE